MVDHINVNSLESNNGVPEQSLYNKESHQSKFPLACCDKIFRRKSDDATGFGLIRMGNGPLLASNIFLSTAFITLAQKDIGCYYEDDDIEHPECGKVYGFEPSSLITIIGVISGIMAALFCPIIGAVIDCTPHRRIVGAVASTLMISIQAVQIGTVQSTWFPMLILQAINGFIYQVQTLAAFSYLSEIARDVGETKMTSYTAKFSIYMFGAESLYLILIIGLSMALKLGDGPTAQLGQGVDVVVSGIIYYYGWKFFTNKPASREISNQSSLLFEGFGQVFRTGKGIFKHYLPTMGFFFSAVIFAEAAANAFTVVAVTYLKEVLDFNGSTIGIIFLVVLVSTIPGSYLGAYISKKTCPKTSMKLQLIIFIGFNFVSFLTMTSPDRSVLAYVYGIVWGMLLGWFYPTENLIFSMIIPKGQESELTGFFLYCTQILSWLPPLIFTVMNESGVPLKWGGIHLNIYFLLALMFYQLMSPWSTCIECAQSNKLRNTEVEMESICINE